MYKNICLLGLSFFMMSCATYTGKTHVRSNSERADFSEKKNVAAGYTATMNFFIGRVARNCKVLLKKDDFYMNNLVNTWKIANGKYVDAAVIWTAATIRRISQEKGMQAGNNAVSVIRDTVSDEGERMANDLLSGNENNQKMVCHNFKNEILSGKYDISQNHEILQGMNEIIDLTN